MMGMLWVVLLVALTGAPLGQGLPLRSTPWAYPHDPSDTSLLESWSVDSGWFAALPALALVVTAVGLVVGCTWCYRYNDCKLFSASATHLHDGCRPNPPDSGFSEPVNNNISEDNNNGPISLREMQNIANNNAAAYIVSENEERNRASRESVVEFEPLPSRVRVGDPLENYADWFGGEDFPRNRLQYLREIGRGWFGRVVEGEIESNPATPVAVKILNQNASLEDRARFLEEARLYRDVTHDNVLALIDRSLQEDPWILMFQLCSMDLQQYLLQNRPKMAILNEGGVPLQLMCDVASALAYLHSRGYLYSSLSSSSVLVREAAGAAPRGVLGCYARADSPREFSAPEVRAHPPVYTTSSEVWSLGTLIWEVCTWAAPVPPQQPPPPELPCPYRDHLYQVMQLCWNPTADGRPSSSQVHALLNHLHLTHSHRHADTPQQDGYGTSDFEERWQRLKPNTIPKIDEHVALVHAPSTSMASHFTGSDQEFDNAPTTHDTLSVDMDTAVSRSSSIMSDKDPLSVQIKSESLTNLHGSLEDVRNIYLTHNEMAVLECHQGNMSFEDKEDRSDSSVDPWVKDLIAGNQDDDYYRDVSDVIKNLDNILNSEKTSSSESSHQASPSRDNLSLDCKKEYSVQSSMVKSPGITNFQNIMGMGFEMNDEKAQDDEVDRDTIGTLSHSFERHSDTTSQHTLENLTPDTPMKDFDFAPMESPVEVKRQDFEVDSAPEPPHLDTPVEVLPESQVHSAAEPPHLDTELPKDKVDNSASKLPKLKDLCVVSISSVSEMNEQLNVRDCETSCDNLAEILRTQVKPKSIDTKVQNDKDNSLPVLENHKEEILLKAELDKTEAMKMLANEEVKAEECKAMNSVEKILPEVNEIAVNLVENEVIHPAVEIVYRMKQESEKNASEENAIVLQNGSCPPNDLEENIEADVSKPIHGAKEATLAFIAEERVCSAQTLIDLELESTRPGINHKLESFNAEPLILEHHVSTPSPKTPEPVQNKDKREVNPINETEKAEISTDFEIETPNPILPPDLVQSVAQVHTERQIAEKQGTELTEDSIRSDKVATEESNDSTVYMDLINSTNNKTDNISEILQDGNIDETESCLDKPDESACVNNESTVYLDLPSVKETQDFLQAENETSQIGNVIIASTPHGSEGSPNNTLENSVKMNGTDAEFYETKVPIDTAKLEQKQILDLLSPFESPTKSHPTDTYDENSSVVLGPFENLIEYKGVKIEMDIPKEELLAFSSNFSEINLETPSPLRDGNFLNEVPDIVTEDLQFDDLTISEAKKELTDNTDDTDQSATTKHVSPSTPPNSPGIYLASTSQQKYLVDIDLDTPETHYPPIESDSGLSSLQKEIDLNQIELQITTKLAMAENENNMNIEYSGPLTVEGLVSEDDAILRESDAIPEEFLAGNGGAVEERSEGFSLDEECVKALRNELELKLPLAQVAGIEPAIEVEDSEEWGCLPPPPDLVLSYAPAAPAALSPIAEETRHQLSAYENDAWIPSTRTESSESYPEPCNDSTADVTDLPTAAGSDHSTYTIQSRDHSGNHTYTVQKDIPSSKELTMSADSLNGSPFKKQPPVDDRTYNKNDDEKTPNCERISQVSPFLMSPTTDTSAPESVDNATAASTLSKTTVPTDAKHSKPSECLSKATSIDSWCSNDTLYNVEENFDDLAMDADLPQLESEVQELVKSASTETLIHHDDDKELSHCGTYVIHDSRSEPCETFSPDSISDNDNHTYTKVKTDVTGATPSGLTKSELDDSTKNTTKDLAYGTLPSCSNCTTDLVSGIDDPWKFVQPELVRKSPTVEEVIFSPPHPVEDKKCVFNTSPVTDEPLVKKMDSIEITCLQDEINSHKSESCDSQILIDIQSPRDDYRNNMAPSVTSTPLTELVVDDNSVEAIPLKLPGDSESPESLLNSIPNFRTFFQSAEIRPQDISTTMSPEHGSTNQDTGLLLEGESRTLSKNSNRDSMAADRTQTYLDFENSAMLKPQEVHSGERSSPSVESGMSSGDFRQFENSVKACPQDLSSLIDTNSLFLNSERRISEISSNTNVELSNINLEVSNTNVEASNFDQTSQSNRAVESVRTLDISPPNITNLEESHSLIPSTAFNMFITDLDEEETDQPHSIIITDAPLVPVDVATKIVEPNKALPKPDQDLKELESPNKTFDSHTELKPTDMNHTYDSHENRSVQKGNSPETEHKVNGIVESKPEISEPPKTEVTNITTDIPNGIEPITCNGNSENYAIVNFINENFEELADNSEHKESKEPAPSNGASNHAIEVETVAKTDSQKTELVNGVEDKAVAVTEDFLQNEKKFCTLDAYLPLLSDISFTGPATDIMSTSFTQDSPTEPASPECERESKPDAVADLVKEWDSDSDSHSSNSSSGEFIWKDGDGHETQMVTTTHFDHQQKGNGSQGPSEAREGEGDGAASEGSGESGSGSEGDEVEFVPSSWDCRAAPGKSSLRSLEQAIPCDNKKRVVFKRQKYHCVYEYPRELADVDHHSPAYLPDLSTYCEWDPTSAEEAELGYGQLYGSPLDMYQLRSGIAFGSDYDEDFISSSARPFESLGLLSSSSQFFPGMHAKAAPLASLPAPPAPAPPSPPPPPALLPATPSLDFTTPDSGVEDITPGSTTTEDDFKKKLVDTEVNPCWRPPDSASSSESVSPSSPGGEALGGLRHTRDKLKLDLPPSPHIPSPRHNRVFNFVLDKPKRHRIPDEKPAEVGTTPLVMSDDTPVITTTLPIEKDAEESPPEPTFSTFGKCTEPDLPEQKIILTDEVQEEKEESPKVETGKEGTVVDSGDEDSGIESSSKATLERKTPNVS